VSTISRSHRSRLKAASAALLAVSLVQPAAAIEDKNFSFGTTEDLYRICSDDAADPPYTGAQVACTAFIEATVQ